MGVDREALRADFDALDAALDKLFGYDCDALRTPELLAWLARVERLRRRLPALEHAVINTVARQATPEELGGTLSHAIAQSTLISRTEAARRIREAADLGERHGLSGEPLPPILAGTAAGQRQGALGAAHIAAIRHFYHRLPAWVDQPTREKAETDLARWGTQIRPEELSGLAEHLANAINPDGTYTDTDRAHRRSLTLSPQGDDTMSHLSGWITPELRATLEAVWAKLAAPGMCNP